jgi:hypothetical protein
LPPLEPPSCLCPWPSEAEMQRKRQNPIPSYCRQLHCQLSVYTSWA